MRKINLILLALLIITSASACRKKPDSAGATANTSTNLNLIIRNVVADEPLFLFTKKYKNEAGSSFTVDVYKYYISNIVLETADGQKYKEPESYHLIDEADSASRVIILKNLPVGNYVKMSFLLGVDSIRNVSGAQSGDLDPAKNMFWDWDSGYIMAMLEGTYNETEMFIYHQTGFKGEYNILRNINISFPHPAKVKSGTSSTVYMTSDVTEWFKTPFTVDLSKMPTGFGGKESIILADNYVDMFKVTHVD